MATTFWSNIREEARKNFILVFQQNWPMWLAGIFLAFLAVMILLWGEAMWGIIGGMRNWGDWILYSVGIYNQSPELSPWMSHLSLTNIGLVLGALSSALLAGQFKIRSSSWYEYAKGAVGGALMGIGAGFAFGCNIGGFYSPVGMFSMGGYAMMIGLGIGAYLGLRYLIWEMMNIPQQASAPPSSREMPREPLINWSKVSPYAGGILAVLLVLAFYLYAVQGQTTEGGLLFLGALIGLTMHRSRFCMARAFREPFMTGDATMVRAVALSLIVYGMASAIIKYNWLVPPEVGVFHPFWLGSLIGGIIFGVGMLLAGGCGSGTLWRLGEGHIKIIIAVIFMALSNSLTYTALHHFEIADRLGSGTFMPDVFGWPLSMVIFILIPLLWALWAIWNEKTEKFVAF